MDSIQIVTGDILVSDEGVDANEYYKTASEGLENYFKFQEEPKNRLEAIDTAMRVVLIPHHRKIDALQSQLKQKDAEIAEVKKDLKKALSFVKVADQFLDAYKMQKAALAEARKGLEYYGDKRNWTIDHRSHEEEKDEIEFGEFAQTIRNDCDPIDTSKMHGTYGGKTAREALKKIDEIMEGK